MFICNTPYFDQIDRIPAKLREEIFERLVMVDYSNARFTVVQQKKDSSWRLRWRLHDRTYSIGLGMDPAIAEAVRIMMDRRSLQDLSLALLYHVHQERIERELNRQIKREMQKQCRIMKAAIYGTNRSPAPEEDSGLVGSMRRAFEGEASGE